MVDIPDRAQPGDELERQLVGSNLSFTEGLAQRREQASQRTKSLEEFQAGEGAENIEAIRGINAPGLRPSDVLRTALGVESFGRESLSNAAEDEIEIVKLIKDSLGEIQDRVDEEESFIEDTAPLLMAIRDGDITLKDLSTTERADVIRLAKLNGISLPKGAEEIDTNTQEKINQFAGINSLIDQLKQDAKDISVFTYLNPLRVFPDDKLEKFNRTKSTLTQNVSKLLEKGTLSDKDRQFIIDNITNISPLGMTKQKDDALERFKREIASGSGLSQENIQKAIGSTTTAGKTRLKSPTGDVYEWEAGDPEIQEALDAGYERIE